MKILSEVLSRALQSKLSLYLSFSFPSLRYAILHLLISILFYTVTTDVESRVRQS